ncbi:hypothetical protein QYE76_008217, partial [Lolium multiflorum]
KRMKKLHTDGLLESLDFESLDRCEACLMGKMTKTPFSGMMERATDLLKIIHTDVCGPMSVASRGGYRYVLTFTDDLSRYEYIYFMKHKSKTFEKFKEFQSEVENQRNKKIKFLRSDRGGEYLSYEFGMHLKKCGILSQLTPPGTPQRNGVSERRNRTLLDMVHSMMSLTDLPLSFWSYALETAAFTLNRAPSKSVETTPYELWFNKKPKLSFLKVWGCEAYVKKLQPDKLEPKSEKCVFIGYPKETIGYTFYHRSEGKIFVAKNGTFLEKEFLTKEYRKLYTVPPTPATEEANDNDHETSNEETTEPRRSTRERATPDWYDPCLNVMIVDNNDEDPATYEEAMMSPDSNKWQEAMKSEMGSMYDNKVWTLVDLPDSRKAVENKWIFKRKTDADGNITVYKARLVAKGFRQIQGVDYDETFSPVAKLKSVRILLAIAAFFDYEIWQMDVKMAFLNGDIEEELYMVQPKGFVDPKNADKVCKLQRSIYGLKQASRSWNRRFDKVIKDFGFIQCHGEACIYKKVSGSSVAFLILYVDDILLIGNDIELLSSVKGYLNNSFSMKDLGEASYILGIKIYRDRSRRLIRPPTMPQGLEAMLYPSHKTTEESLLQTTRTTATVATTTWRPLKRKKHLRICQTLVPETIRKGRTSTTRKEEKRTETLTSYQGKPIPMPMAPPTRNNSRAPANQIHTEHAKMTDAINILAMERKALRHQHAKKDYLIARLRVKIASLEQLIPIPHHAPRAKSNVTCYTCGVMGHYSNKCPVKAANNAPRTGSHAVPIAQTNKSTATCYECGTVGHYSNECRKKLAKIATNPAAPAQQRRRIATRRKFAPNYPNNRNGRYYNLAATEAQEASQNMPSMCPAKSYHPISPRNLTLLKISGRDLFKGEGFVTPQISK